MPPMCRSYPDVHKLRGMETTILGQHRPFMSIKSFVQHSGWQEMVSLCSLIRLIGVCADRDQPECLSDSRCLKVHVATAGGWLTRYRPREVRNSIYRYRKIHIDYRSNFLYRFISSISIIYGNTSYDRDRWHWKRYICQLLLVRFKYIYIYIWSLCGSIFRITGPLWGESTGYWWLLLTKASDAKLWCFLWCEPEQMVEQTMEDVIDLRRHGAHYDVTVMKWICLISSWSWEKISAI